MSVRRGNSDHVARVPRSRVRIADSRRSRAGPPPWPRALTIATGGLRALLGRRDHPAAGLPHHVPAGACWSSRFLFYPGASSARDRARRVVGRLDPRGPGRWPPWLWPLLTFDDFIYAPPIRRRPTRRFGALADRSRARGDAPDAGSILPFDGGRLRGLRLLRSAARADRARDGRPPRLRPGAHRRHPLHDARGRLRRAARRGVDLHHRCSRSSARC